MAFAYAVFARFLSLEVAALLEKKESFPLSFVEFVPETGGRGLRWTQEMVAHAIFQQFRHDGFMY